MTTHRPARVAGARRTPTIAQAVADHLPTLTGSLAKYRTYWRWWTDGLPPLPPDPDLPPGYAAAAAARPAVPGLGIRRLDHLTAGLIAAHASDVRRQRATGMLRDEVHAGTAASSDPDRLGAGVYESMIDSMTYLLRVVHERCRNVDPGLTRGLRPTRRPTPVLPFSLSQLADIFRVLGQCSDDPVLDRLLLDGALRSAARQEGLLNATVASLHPEMPAVYVVEKYGKDRYLPMPQYWLADVRTVMAGRGAVRPEDRLFRYEDGTPLTGRRFDHITRLLKQHLDWAALRPCGPHSLRHTTLDWLRSVTTPQVVAAFAGHTLPGATRHYQHPTFDELTIAAIDLFGPLDAARPRWAFDPIGLPAVAERLARHGRYL